MNQHQSSFNHKPKTAATLSLANRMNRMHSKPQMRHKFSPDSQSIKDRYLPKDPYNQNPGRKLMKKARRKDQSEKKYLAQSQQVMSEVDNNASQNYGELDDFQIRPITTEGGNRIQRNFASNEMKSHHKSAPRKSKPRVFRLQNSNKGSRRLKKHHNFQTERVSSVDTYKADYQQNQMIYNERNIKELRISDYLTGMNRLNRYIKKTKKKLQITNNGVVRTYVKAKGLSPFKKSILNVSDIYDFVQMKKQSQDQEGEDSEAMVIQEKGQIRRNNNPDEKQKWK
jgi:uncharacterized protein YfkK (UPF0435 family)